MKGFNDWGAEGVVFTPFNLYMRGLIPAALEAMSTYHAPFLFLPLQTKPLPVL